MDVTWTQNLSSTKATFFLLEEIDFEPLIIYLRNVPRNIHAKVVKLAEPCSVEVKTAYTTWRVLVFFHEKLIIFKGASVSSVRNKVKLLQINKKIKNLIKLDQTRKIDLIC